MFGQWRRHFFVIKPMETQFVTLAGKMEKIAQDDQRLSIIDFVGKQ